MTDLSIPGPAGPISARHYRADGRRQPLLVFFHGGGWVLGDIETHDGLCRLICRDAGMHVLSVDYRLAPGAQGARRGRRRLRGLPLGARPCRRTGRRPGPHRRRRRQRGRQPRRRGVAAGPQRGRTVAGPAAADLPGHQPRRRNAVAHAVRRGATSSPSAISTGSPIATWPGRGSSRPTPACRRCWPTTCPACRRRWC